jgi:flagellar biosynthesis protein
VPLDPLVGTLVRGQPTTPAQTNDVSRRFVVGQTLKGVVLRTLPEGQTLVNFAGQHVVLALPQPLSPGHTLLATVQHITPTLVLKVLAEPGALGVNSPQAQITPPLLGRLAETAEPLDPVQLKSYLGARQPFGEMVVALRQHLVHNPVLRGLDADLLQRLADTLSALLPQDTTLPDAGGLQAQVDRSGINYEAKVAEALTKQATPAERQTLVHDLKGQLLELAARLDQASRQGHDVGASQQQVQQALRNIAATDSAPIITATGHGVVAEKIIALARDNGVPLRQDADLVQVLSQLDLRQEIPPSLYQVVAELLAFIYRLNNDYRPLSS